MGRNQGQYICGVGTYNDTSCVFYRINASKNIHWMTPDKFRAWVTRTGAKLQETMTPTSATGPSAASPANGWPRWTPAIWSLPHPCSAR
jgi:hypothetical protein